MDHTALNSLQLQKMACEMIKKEKKIRKQQFSPKQNEQTNKPTNKLEEE